MAKLDGTGPQGAGPRTGWGRGPCGGGMNRGRGYGCGFGGRRQMTGQEEKDALKNEAEYLEEELKIVKSQLAEIKDQK